MIHPQGGMSMTAWAYQKWLIDNCDYLTQKITSGRGEQGGQQREYELCFFKLLFFGHEDS